MGSGDTVQADGADGAPARQDGHAAAVMSIADRLFGAIERGDMDSLRQLYHPQARIWHNTDGQEQSVEDNLRVLRWLVRHTRARAYEDIRRDVIPGGFVQQHVLKLQLATGRTVRIPACLVATTDQGRITRIDEYLDSAQVADLDR